MQPLLEAGTCRSCPLTNQRGDPGSCLQVLGPMQSAVHRVHAPQRLLHAQVSYKMEAARQPESLAGLTACMPGPLPDNVNASMRCSSCALTVGPPRSCNGQQELALHIKLPRGLSQAPSPSQTEGQAHHVTQLHLLALGGPGAQRSLDGLHSHKLSMRPRCQ